MSAATAICSALLLAACGGGSSGGGGSGGDTTPTNPAGNTVSATAQSSTVVGVVGKPGNVVTVNFATSTGTATNLTIDPASLPAGWSAAATNVCASVASSGCAATLTYTPTSATAAAQTFNLKYQYTDDQGKAQTGSTSLSYSARQAFLYVTQVTNTASGSGLPTGTVSNGSLVRCSTNNDGTLGTCADSGATGVEAPLRILFNGNDAYVAQLSGLAAITSGASGAFSGNVLHCTADPATGALSGCADSGVAGLVLPVGLAVSGTSMYVLDSETAPASSNVQRCQIGANGALSGCAMLSLQGVPASALELLTSVAVANNNLYIVGGDSNAAVRCPINPDGSVATCSLTPANAPPVNSPDEGPFDLKFNGANAYMVSGGSTTDALLQCPVNADGTLNSCTSSSLPVPAVGLQQAVSVALVGSTAYITNEFGSNLVQCSLHADGTVGTCATTASPAFNATFGLATY